MMAKQRKSTRAPTQKDDALVEDSSKSSGKPGMSLTGIAVSVFQTVVPGLDSGFTRWNVFFCMVTATGVFPEIYPVVFCTTWGVFISFNSAPLLDPTAFPRLAESLGMKSMVMFHIIYNFVAHALPCIVMAMFPPNRILWWSGLVAAGIHFGWGLAISRGTMQLNETYIPMKPGSWYLMWASAVATEIAAPFYIYPAALRLREIIGTV